MAEGAALEMPCRGNSTVGSNPTPSAIYFHPQHGEAMLTVDETIRTFPLAQSVVVAVSRGNCGDIRDHNVAGWREGASCEAAPEGSTRGVLSVR